MKTSMQLKALIRNISKEKSVESEVILRNYMLERLLERISVSQYREKFILKGGMLISAMVGIDTRSTMDMDATIRGVEFSEDVLKEAIENILEIQIDDGVSMTLMGLENIRDESEYPGIRVSIEAILDKTRQIMKVDVTAGDIITPRVMEYSFKMMFDERKISILAYNLETVLSEKLETILIRGTTTTRMRDYYDIYILTNLRAGGIDWDIFHKAFKRTSEKRDSYEKIIASGIRLLYEIEKSKTQIELWKRYQKKNNYAADLGWDQVIKSLHELYSKAIIN